jgi:hypothetical protein
MLPAIVAPKLKYCATVAGAVGVLTKSFPLTPAATTKTRRSGTQTQFSNLQVVRKMLRLFLMGGDNAHQLRALIPQKDTYPWKRSGIEGI